MNALRVIRPGLLTTIQDRGRWGLQARGVSVAGPMDPRAHRVANALVGNLPDAATLEITLLGPELELESDRERWLAVAGARFEMSLDDGAAPMNRGFKMCGGGRLRFHRRLQGARAYLAVDGGIAVPPVLGSRSTHLPSRLGGLDGRALQRGDFVPLSDPPRAVSVHSAALAGDLTDLPQSHAVLRVLPGPDRDRFADSSFAALQSAAYAVAPESNRMGFRLQGPVLRHSRGADIISDATPLGTVQVPASGLPILLMADRQVTGGYPRIATVIAADIGLAGQLGPGDSIRFAVCEPHEAMAALQAQERAIMAMEAAVA
jgi:antagonist of KipI